MVWPWVIINSRQNMRKVYHFYQVFLIKLLNQTHGPYDLINGTVQKLLYQPFLRYNKFRTVAIYIIVLCFV